MWKLVKFSWKVISFLRFLVTPALLILAAVVGYLLMEKLVMGGFTDFRL